MQVEILVIQHLVLELKIRFTLVAYFVIEMISTRSTVHQVYFKHLNYFITEFISTELRPEVKPHAIGLLRYGCYFFTRYLVDISLRFFLFREEFFFRESFIIRKVELIYVSRKFNPAYFNHHH